MSHQKRPPSSKPSPSSLLAIFSEAPRDKKSGLKRKRSSLEAFDEMDSASSSSSFTLSGAENDAKMAFHQKNELSRAQIDSLDSHIGSDESESSAKSQLSAESHFYHEGDGTRRREFDNSILLYSTEVMKRLAMDATQETVETSGSQDEGNYNQQLVLANDRHTKAIIDTVRRRLRESSLPELYASISGGDTCKEGMERINKERMMAVEKTALLSSKLAEQKEQLEKRLDIEISKRDKLKEEEEWISQMSRKKIHPFLASYLERSEKGAEDTGKSKKQKSTTLEYIPAPPGTMTKLLDKISNKHL